MELVEVAWVGDEYEGAMLQALLEENGIPSIQKQVGIDGGQLAHAALTGGGSRLVLVHPHHAEEARSLVSEARVEHEQDAGEPVNARYLAEAQGKGPRRYGLLGGYARIYGVSFGTMALAIAVLTILRAV